MKHLRSIHLVLVLCLAFSAFACRLFVPDRPSGLDPAAEEQDVYTAVFAPDTKFLALRAETGVSFDNQPAEYDFFDGANPALKKATYEDFVARNSQEYALAEHFTPAIPHVFLTQDEAQAIFNDPDQDGWEEFYAAYPGSGGLTGLSRVGFDPSGTQALVYQDELCGPLCGAGFYILFEKEDGKWVERWRLMAWIS
jgi:hypothetical protein